MSIITKIRTAFAEKTGAVTVDWVVLTAAVVILSIGAISALDGGITTMISSINDELTFSNVSAKSSS